jgi:DNA-binding NarL/FixJ family response regulator
VPTFKPLPTPPSPFTPREKQVLRLVADGLGNTAIGERLCISVKTVEAHKSNIAKRMGCGGSSFSLYKTAMATGLLKPEDPPEE